jgi:hypothetical protein
MQLKIRYFIFTFILFFLLDAFIPLRSLAEGLHTLIEFTGDVSIKKHRKQSFEKLDQYKGTGIPLHDGDVFRLSGRAMVIIECSDKKIKHINPGKPYQKVSSFCIKYRNPIRVSAEKSWLRWPSPAPIRGMW